MLQNRRIAFIHASWHGDIVQRGRDSFLSEIEKGGIAKQDVDLFEVPGSLEIPLQAKLLAKGGRYAAIVAAGFVVDGGIYRHEFVAETVIDGMMRVQLETEVPIISLVLTPQRFHAHDDHNAFFREHFKVKGEEAARACVRVLENVEAARRRAVD
jgi:6,7-dimethyl-8-ribityllumazine synthase